MKTVIAYVRVSTDAQAGEDRFGIAAQEELIHEYVDSHEMRIGKWVYDRGESGAKLRPGFDEIVYGDSLINPPYEAVVVAKSDRVARDINVYYYYKMLLRQKEMELISISEDFGAMGPFAPMLEAFTICAAQMERENITKRTSTGRIAKARTGGYAGGRVPMGYKCVDGKLIINEDEAKVVRFIFKCKKKMTMWKTVEALREEGYKTRGGKDFAISTIQSIWNNERLYRGEYRYGNSGWVQGQHEPILK